MFLTLASVALGGLLVVIGIRSATRCRLAVRSWPVKVLEFDHEEDGVDGESIQIFKVNKKRTQEVRDLILQHGLPSISNCDLADAVFENAKTGNYVPVNHRKLWMGWAIMLIAIGAAMIGLAIVRVA